MLQGNSTAERMIEAMDAARAVGFDAGEHLASRCR